MARGDGVTVDVKALARLLKAVNLGGLIDECVLNISKGKASVQAVDLSNALFLSCQEIVGMADMKIGVGKLTTVQKFLDSGGDFAFAFGDSKMTVKRLQPAGELRTVLLAAEQVPTAVQQGGSEDELMKHVQASVDINKETAESLLYYNGLVDAPSIVFTAHANGDVIADSSAGMDQEFSFKLGVGAKEDRPKDTVSAEVYTKYLLPVLRALTWGDGQPVPRLHIGQDVPIVVTIGDNYLWALTPVVK